MISAIPNPAKMADALRALGCRVGAGAVAQAICDNPMKLRELLEASGCLGSWEIHGERFGERYRFEILKVRPLFAPSPPPVVHIHDWVVTAVRRDSPWEMYCIQERCVECVARSMTVTRERFSYSPPANRKWSSCSLPATGGVVNAQPDDQPRLDD